MTAMSRNKGASGERELAHLLHAELGITFQRNLEQVRSGGGDLIPNDPAFPFLIEVKRRRSGWTCEAAWAAQVFKATENSALHPCVAYRFDKRAWRFRVWLDSVAEAVGGHAVCGQWADMDIQGFCWVAREIMARRTGGGWRSVGEVARKMVEQYGQQTASLDEVLPEGLEVRSGLEDVQPSGEGDVDRHALPDA